MNPAKYLNCLSMQAVVDENDIPLKSRNGKQLYRLTAPLSFYSAELDIIVTAPTDFITDLDSTPRLPIVYLLMNAFGDMPAATHDYVYSTGIFPRAQCDALLREACLATGVPKWQASVAYYSVRMGGGSHYVPAKT